MYGSQKNDTNSKIASKKKKSYKIVTVNMLCKQGYFCYCCYMFCSVMWIRQSSDLRGWIQRIFVIFAWCIAWTKGSQPEGQDPIKGLACKSSGSQSNLLKRRETEKTFFATQFRVNSFKSVPFLNELLDDSTSSSTSGIWINIQINPLSINNSSLVNW